jgi:hypothetical protein
MPTWFRFAAALLLSASTLAEASSTASAYSLGRGSTNWASVSELFRNVDGRSARAQLFDHRLILVDLVASWCDACRNDLEYEKANRAIASGQVTWIVVDERESPGRAVRWLQRYVSMQRLFIDEPDRRLADSGPIDRRRNYYFYGPQGMFGAFAEAFGVSELPAHIVFDSCGNSILVWTGAKIGAEMDYAVRISRDRGRCG